MTSLLGGNPQRKKRVIKLGKTRVTYVGWKPGTSSKQNTGQQQQQKKLIPPDSDVKTKAEKQLDDVITLRVSGKYAHAQVALTSTNGAKHVRPEMGGPLSRTQECYLCTRLATNEIIQPGNNHSNEYCHVRS
ncbi:hypothetical protein GHT06_011255 [Daphnia sinensis]|uniref:Uncharacterized protein n=1 Tax=Daphnia sinensis TaxID=1820382 RepID=A0AAD5Q1X5_9CRUS|nr:hypothetical protein GHT06_011255 [Daphnia sinensis]